MHLSRRSFLQLAAPAVVQAAGKPDLNLLHKVNIERALLDVARGMEAIHGGHCKILVDHSRKYLMLSIR